MSQEGRPVTYFNEKLNNEKRMYSIYNKNFMLLFKNWRSGDTIFFLKSLFCIVIIKLCNILIVKVNWTKRIWSGLSFCRVVHLFWSTKVVNLIELQVHLVKDICCWHRCRLKWLGWRNSQICIQRIFILLNLRRLVQYLLC